MSCVLIQPMSFPRWINWFRTLPTGSRPSSEVFGSIIPMRNFHLWLFADRCHLDINVDGERITQRISVCRYFGGVKRTLVLAMVEKIVVNTRRLKVIKENSLWRFPALRMYTAKIYCWSHWSDSQWTDFTFRMIETCRIGKLITIHFYVVVKKNSDKVIALIKNENNAQLHMPE